MDLMETCFNYSYQRNHNDHVAWFSSNEVRFINKIHKLKKEHPDEVIIKAEPEDNDGCIYCSLPQEWLRIQAPVKQNLTDEERMAIRDRLQAGRK